MPKTALVGCIAVLVVSCGTSAAEKAASDLMITVDGETPLEVANEGFSRDDEYSVNYVIPDEHQSLNDLSIEVIRPANRTEDFEIVLQRAMDNPSSQGVARFVSDGCSYFVGLLNQSGVLSVRAYVSCGIESAPEEN